MDERNEHLSEDGKSIVKACIRSMHDHARAEKKKMALSPEDRKELRKKKKMTARKNRVSKKNRGKEPSSNNTFIIEAGKQKKCICIEQGSNYEQIPQYGGRLHEYPCKRIHV